MKFADIRPNWQSASWCETCQYWFDITAPPRNDANGEVLYCPMCENPLVMRLKPLNGNVDNGV